MNVTNETEDSIDNCSDYSRYSFADEAGSVNGPRVKRPRHVHNVSRGNLSKRSFPDYDAKTAEMEKRFMFVTDSFPSRYLMLTSTGDYHFGSERDFLQTTRSEWFTEGWDEEKQDYINKNWGQRWIVDPDKKSIKGIVNVPSCVAVEDGFYNVWNGLAAEKLRDEQSDELIEYHAGIVRDHLTMLLGTEAHSDYVMDFFAHIVQFPHIKTQIIIVFIGENGTGKNIILDFFREKIIGVDKSTQGTTASHFFGPHSNALEKSVFCIWDEVKYAQIEPYREDLKNAVTSDFINVNHKFKEPYMARNNTNWVMTTNNKFPFKCPASERRFVVFGCSEAKKNDHEYFAELGHHLQDARVAYGFYHHLLRRDVAGKNFQACRPVTCTMTSLSLGTLSDSARYLSHLVLYNRTFDQNTEQVSFAKHPDGTVLIGITVLYKDFREWNMSRGVVVNNDKINSLKAFSRQINEIMTRGCSNGEPNITCGLVRRKMQNGMHLVIDFDALKKHLEKYSILDQDIA